MKKKAILIPITALALAAGSTGCSAGTAPGAGAAAESSAAPSPAGSPLADPQPLADAAQPIVIEDQAVPLYSKPAGSYVRTPIASGTVTYELSLIHISIKEMEGFCPGP